MTEKHFQKAWVMSLRSSSVESKRGELYEGFGERADLIVEKIEKDEGKAKARLVKFPRGFRTTAKQLETCLRDLPCNFQTLVHLGSNESDR